MAAQTRIGSDWADRSVASALIHVEIGLNGYRNPINQSFNQSVVSAEAALGTPYSKQRYPLDLGVGEP